MHGISEVEVQQIEENSLPYISNEYQRQRLIMFTSHPLQKLLLFLILTVGYQNSLWPQSHQMNVVIVLVDDLGWKDLGHTGSPLYHTPNLDKLATEATVFTQAYSGHPVCSPSRAAIMTGKNPTRLGITDWIPGQRPANRPLTTPGINNELALEEKTIAEYFKDNNYKTFFAGKWHLGEESHGPETQGFDINVGGIDKGSPPGGYYSPYNNPKLEDGPEGEYLPDRLTSETIRFITENKDHSFLAFLSFYTVHTPIQASKEDRPGYEGISIPEVIYPEHEAYSLLYQNNLDYASMITAMDRNVGLLIENLKRLKLWENTIFVFTSDNGGLSTLQWNQAAPTSNLPLRAGKGWCYEGGIRIPQLIYIPEKSSRVPQIDHPTVHQDLLPTVLIETGAESNLPSLIDGKNIFSDRSVENRTLYWDFPHYHGSGWKPGAAIRQGDWKLIFWYENDKTELYNLKTDPGETQDVSQKFPDQTQTLKKLLDTLIDKDGGQRPTANTEYEPPE